MANAALADLPTYSVSNSRLKSIYSDLSRQKTSNPAAFTANVDWWKRTLNAYVERGLQANHPNALVLDASPELAESFRYGSVGIPLGMAAVIIELRSTRSFIPLNDFLNSPTSVYYTGSLAYRVASFALGKPLWWAFEQLNLVDTEHAESESTLWKSAKGEYVVLSNVERAADTVLEKLRERTTSSPVDSLYSYDSFRRLFCAKGAVFENVCLSETDLRVLIKFMDRDRHNILSDKDAIKFVDSSTPRDVGVLTGVDKSILELKTGVENMERSIQDINERIAEKTRKATDALRGNRKDLALTLIKSRKLYEELLKKRLGSLEILQTTLIQVETAAQDIEIMKQYESSTATLRSLLAHPSLQRDSVDATMDAMAEASASTREIDDAIRLGGVANPEAAGVDLGIDEDALQAELDMLVADVRAEEKEKEELRAIEERHREERREEQGQQQNGEKVQGQSLAQALPSAPSGIPSEMEAGSEGRRAASSELVKVQKATVPE